MFTSQQTQWSATQARVNDVHSRLNDTSVDRILRPTSINHLISIVHSAAISGERICIGGGRHAMGSQQFQTDGIFLDMTSLNSVLSFDRSLGLLEVESGIQWPAIINYLREAQPERDGSWCIRQKQTGADNLTIGGAVSANVHGRGLKFKPFVEDIESIRVVTAKGESVLCSRDENSDLFKLVVGGYGLFGLIYSVTLRLVRATKLIRAVQIARTDKVMDLFDQRIANGATYGDYQFAIDHNSESFLREGIFSTYTPGSAGFQPANKSLSHTEWHRLVYLAHYDKTEAFRLYSKHYLSTNGQTYWSDTNQLGIYADDYHSTINDRPEGLAGRMPALPEASEIITELYVPGQNFAQFMEQLRSVLLQRNADVIYGTVRLIEQDDESVLAWAKKSFACIVLNLHTEHDQQSLDSTADTFRALIDTAIAFGGSFYLTYHKFARKDQLLACYPEFPWFLAQKRRIDPVEIFSSNWYEHCKRTLANE
jgi:FAD/FMN-containing dehydrogenase